MNRCPFAVLFALVSLSAPAICQRGSAPYYEDTKNIPVSPEIHPDRTVGFASSR
jgi:hypothetical protein